MKHIIERERPSRSARWIDARVRSRGQPEIPAVISNISEAGCRIESAVAFEAGEPIEILVPRLGSVSAVIKWSEAGHSGAAFVPDSDHWLHPDPDAVAQGRPAQGANGNPFG